MAGNHHHRTLRLAALCAVAASLQAGGLAEKIDGLIRASPVARQAFWGIQVIEAESGATVYERKPDHLFVPASNTKLFTTALALSRLGPDYRFVTRVVSGGAPDAEGRVAGLRLVGGGDPNLSARPVPYQKGDATGDPLTAIEDLADQVARQGVRRVDGDIIGDDTLYVWEPWPDGWALDDPLWEYGAPVSALCVNDNTITLRIEPGAREGEPARLTLSPPLEYYWIDNRVRTTAAAERKVHVDRLPGSRQLRLWGALPPRDRGQTVALGVDDPALYAAMALRDALLRRGIPIGGRARAEHRFPDAGASPPPAAEVTLATRTSPPLADDLEITDKVSQNLHAELALLAVARATRQEGSRKAGLEEMQAFLTSAGLPEESYSLHDGSGLSRLNLVSPNAVVALLRYMYASPNRDTWIGLLPSGGEDGTLSGRFTAAQGRIRAKTGSLSHVSALSGYATRRDGKVLIFSILVNNFGGPTSEVRAVIDRICTLLVR